MKKPSEAPNYSTTSPPTYFDHHTPNKYNSEVQPSTD